MSAGSDAFCSIAIFAWMKVALCELRGSRSMFSRRKPSMSATSDCSIDRSVGEASFGMAGSAGVVGSVGALLPEPQAIAVATIPARETRRPRDLIITAPGRRPHDSRRGRDARPVV